MWVPLKFITVCSLLGYNPMRSLGGQSLELDKGFEFRLCGLL